MWIRFHAIYQFIPASLELLLKCLENIQQPNPLASATHNLSTRPHSEWPSWKYRQFCIHWISHIQYPTEPERRFADLSLCILLFNSSVYSPLGPWEKICRPVPLHFAIQQFSFFTSGTLREDLQTCPSAFRYSTVQFIHLWDPESRFADLSLCISLFNSSVYSPLGP